MSEQTFTQQSGDDGCFYSLPEACGYLKVSRSTLYKHTSAGRIAHFKPNGKLIVFKKSDLDEWVLRGRIPSQEELQKDV